MRVFGHRGSPGFPRFGENTRTSFRAALEAGAAGFELDVRRAADGTLIVIHDATIDRTTNGAGRVSSLSYEQLSRFDAGHGDSIPRLTDILDEFGHSCTIHIELKEANLAEDVASHVQQRGINDHVVVIAFDTDDNDKGASANWLELASVAAELPVALLATRRKIQRIGLEGFITAAHSVGASAIHPARDAATPALIQLARKSNLPTRVWTVNNSEEVTHWLELGVDAILSDFPKRCIEVLTG